MSTLELEKSALQLPVAERLQLARRLVESIGDSQAEEVAIEEGVRRIEDIVSGKVRGLTEEEFWRSLK
jgi:putative addiction module component (TIGR02574 family)